MYKIIRLYKRAGKKSRLIKRVETLEEAQAHCRDPRTSTNDWFDGYEEIKKGRR